MVSRVASSKNSADGESEAKVATEMAAGMSGMLSGKRVSVFKTRMGLRPVGLDLSDRPKVAASASRGCCAREWEALKATYFSREATSLVAINLLIGFVPLGIAAGQLGWSPVSTFALNFLAIMPLAAMLGASTEALSVHIGQTVGGLLNATLGNAVEMSVTISALRAGLIEVVQMSLIGSILSNLLLVMGMSFMCASLKSHESKFNAGGTGANITCMVLASLAFSLPTVFSNIEGTTAEDTLMLSRIIALVMAFVYVAFLIFQLGTHATLFEVLRTNDVEAGDNAGAERLLGRDAGAPGRPAEVDELPLLHPAISGLMLLLSTIAVVMCSEFLVESIQGVSEHFGMSYAFIGLILLPIVGNAAEHTTAVTAAYHDMMDLSLGVAIGSSTQIALFVIPFSVITGWICGVPLTLDFQIFNTTVFVLSVFIASGVLSDGSGNWFEGLMLVATFAIVGIMAWFIPGHAESSRSLSELGALQSERMLLGPPPLGFPQQTSFVI